MLTVVILSIIMLSVVATLQVAPLELALLALFENIRLSGIKHVSGKHSSLFQKSFTTLANGQSERILNQ
jgi:hypothetical protein